MERPIQNPIQNSFQNSVQPAGLSPVQRQTIIAAAEKWEGTPYVHQSSQCGVGADCLGFVRGVYRTVVGPEPMLPPPYRPYPVRGQGEVLLMAAVDVLTPCKVPLPGSILIFRFRPHAPAHHAAICVSDTLMIHASSSRGVCRVGFHPWWRRRLAGTFDFPSVSDD